MKRKRQSPLQTTTQDQVKADYLAALRGDEDALRELHMFFSPWCVPVGLTDEEVSICVTLCRFRDEQLTALVADATKSLEEKGLAGLGNFYPKTLPDELKPSQVMSRARFKAGIYKYLAEISQKNLQRKTTQ